MAFGDIFNPLLAAIKRALGPFGRIFELLGNFWDRLSHLFTRIGELVDLVKEEIVGWRTFKEDIRYRTSVINIPAAVEKTQELIDQIVAAKDAIFDLWSTLKDKFNTANPAEEAEKAVADLEESGIRGFLERFPRLLRGLEKLLGALAIVADALESILNAIDDLTAIVRAARTIREDIETGGVVFLQQKNKRKTVTLTDGTKMKIRIGSLHE